MITTILHVWLSTGQIISGPIPIDDCARHVALAEAAVASGGYAEATEDDRHIGIIVRMQCDGLDVPLALPTSDGDCGEPTA